MATGDKIVTLDGLKAVYDSQDTDGIKQDISDLKSNLNPLEPLDNLVVKNCVYSRCAEIVNRTINVAESGYVNFFLTDQLDAVQNDRFIVALKITTLHSQDYDFTVRMRKATESGLTAQYYFPDPIDYSSDLICSITPTGADVVGGAFQLRYKYKGSEEANFSETFTIEFLSIYKGDIYLYDDLALRKTTSIEQLLNNRLSASYLAKNVQPYYIGLYKNGKYPNVDTVAKTITIYSHTVIFAINGTVYYEVTEDTTISLFTSTQLSKVVFDFNTNTFSCINPTSDRSSERYLTIGLLQNNTGIGWIGIPHTIDGYDPYIKTPNPMWDLPTSWASKVQTIQEAQGKKFMFAVQTDTHYSTEDADDYDGRNLKSLTNFIGFDFVANLGDIIEGYANETKDSPENMRASMTDIMQRYVTGISCPLLVAMGNHDTNKPWADAFGGEPFDIDEVWGREFRPAFNTNPKAVTERGLMYYYTDFEDIRVIVLNTQDGVNGDYGISSTQIGWLSNTALNTDKAVLIVSHVPIVNGWSVSSNYVSSYADAVSAIKNFQTNGGTVIGCISGHTHTQESQTVNGILYVTFKNGASLCEVVLVDPDNKTINTIPVGFTGAGNRSFTFT